MRTGLWPVRPAAEPQAPRARGDGPAASHSGARHQDPEATPVIPLSQRMHRTGGSATAAAMARAAAAKAAGRPVISLTTGEPDGPT
ncbi:MAG: hypothetical protein AAGI50_08375, partial [Pseudomonadota bacterium]